jgi:hypothetical protein
MPAVFAAFLQAASTTTTIAEVPRVVGDPLPLWIWWVAGIVLLIAILAAGTWARSRQRSP